MKIFFFFAVITLFLGCKDQQDDSQRLILSGKFIPEDIVYYDAPLMCTKDKIISDTSIINTYLRNKNRLNSIKYTSTAPADLKYPSIEFLSNDSIILTFPFSPVLIERFKADVVRTPEKEIILNRKDSFVHNTPYPVVPSRCDSIITNWVKYHDKINVYPSHFVMYQRYSFKEIDGVLYNPSSSYIINSVENTGCFSEWGPWNLGTIHKNPFPVNQLLNGDTIVYQTQRVKMKQL